MNGRMWRTDGQPENITSSLTLLGKKTATNKLHQACDHFGEYEAIIALNTKLHARIKHQKGVDILNF